jgi:hypothetical protein
MMTAVPVMVLLAVSAFARCAPPAYSCARTDTDVIPLPSQLPNWGGRLGANTVFSDPSFNFNSPPQYVRVTDSKTDTTGAIPNIMGVGTGSGDDRHFNSDDTLFDLQDAGNNTYVFGLNTSTLNTGLVCRPSCINAANGNYGSWSHIDTNIRYGVGGDGKIWTITLASPGCRLGGGPCIPSSSPLYDFVANCGVSSGIVDFEFGGTPGAGDTIFGAAYSYGNQDTGDEVVAYDRSTSTCYFYNTREGTIRSYAGVETPVTGTVNCNGTGTVTWNSGTQFDSSWPGLYIKIAGTYYEVSNNVTATSLVVYPTSGNCPTGTGLSYSIEPGILVGTVTSSDRYSIHNVRLDPSGTWMVVIEGSYCYGTCEIVHAWQVGTTNVVNCVTACGGHFTENASGWFNFDQIPGTRYDPAELIYRTWANFGTSNTANLSYLNNSFPSVYSDFATHPSNKNDTLGTHSYPVFTATASDEKPAGRVTGVMSNEVIGYHQPSGRFLRFGHTFNSALSTDFTSEYAIGAASSTGKFYMFTTDGEETLPAASNAVTV